MKEVVLDQQYLLKMLREAMENGENCTFNNVQEIMEYLIKHLEVAKV